MEPYPEVMRAPVGSGIIAAMAARGDSPRWANEYQVWDGSFAVGNLGVYYFLPDTGEVKFCPFR